MRVPKWGIDIAKHTQQTPKGRKVLTECPFVVVPLSLAGLFQVIGFGGIVVARIRYRQTKGQKTLR